MQRCPKVPIDRVGLFHNDIILSKSTAMGEGSKQLTFLGHQARELYCDASILGSTE